MDDKTTQSKERQDGHTSSPPKGTAERKQEAKAATVEELNNLVDPLFNYCREHKMSFIAGFYTGHIGSTLATFGGAVPTCLGIATYLVEHLTDEMKNQAQGNRLKTMRELAGELVSRVIENAASKHDPSDTEDELHDLEEYLSKKPSN